MAGDLQHPILLDAQQAPSHDVDSEDEPIRPSSGPSVQGREATASPLQRQDPGSADEAVAGGREEPGSDAESSGSYGR